jgi:hypothetical protein
MNQLDIVSLVANRVAEWTWVPLAPGLEVMAWPVMVGDLFVGVSARSASARDMPPPSPPSDACAAARACRPPGLDLTTSSPTRRPIATKAAGRRSRRLAGVPSPSQRV